MYETEIGLHVHTHRCTKGRGHTNGEKGTDMIYVIHNWQCTFLVHIIFVHF